MADNSSQVIEDKKDAIQKEISSTPFKMKFFFYADDKVLMTQSINEFVNYIKNEKDCKISCFSLSVHQADFTTRKSPCGNGTATWSKNSMRVFQQCVKVVIPEFKSAQVCGFLKTLQIKVRFVPN